MRLTELEPRWIHQNLFVFLCPHCRKDLLTCKNAAISMRQQAELFSAAFGEPWNILVVPANPDFSWTISGDFSTMTVAPSIDASASGHWHGNIANGEVR